MKVKVKDNQNIFDAAIQYYGSIEGLAQLMADNSFLTLDGQIDKGTELFINESMLVDKSAFELTGDKELVVATGSAVPDYEDYVPSAPVIVPGQTVVTHVKIKIKDNQNIIDLAIQYYGSVDGIVQLKLDNPGLTIDGLMEKGTVLVIDPEKVVNMQVLEYIDRNGLIVATGSKSDHIGDFWITQNGDFVIDEDNNFAIY